MIRSKGVLVAAGVTVALVLVALGVGIGRYNARASAQMTAIGKMHPEASARAVAFYRGYYLGQNYGAAWDMSIPNVFGPHHPNREEFIEFWSKRLEPKADEPFEIKQMVRGADYLYLISDSSAQHLIWVTLTPEGWKVRAFDYHNGGEVPWSPGTGS